MKCLFLVLTLASCSTLLFSQNPAPGTDKMETIECAADVLHQTLMQTDPDYRRQTEELEKAIQQIIQNKTKAEFDHQLLTIPVVVHVIHQGEPIGTGVNISEDKIYGAKCQLG